MSILPFNIPVPVAGDGPIVDVSTLVGKKTVMLSGGFTGTYDLLASHDGSTFTPILQFNAGASESVRQTASGAFNYFRLRSNATALGAVVCEVSALAGAGQNRFLTVGNLPPGFQGYSPIIDTAVAFPPGGAEEDICFICVGSLVGQVVILGSIDGVDFNPIGSFRADEVPEGSPTSVLEFSLFNTEDKTRYLRLYVNSLDSIGGLVVTMGGRLLSSGGTTTAAGICIDDSTGRTTKIDAPGEEILYEVPIDLDTVPVGTLLTPQWQAVVAVSYTSTGTFRLYVGSTTPGNTAGGTVRALLSTSSPSDVLATVTGPPFANPGGKVFVQITGINDTPHTEVSEIVSYSLMMN